MCDTACRVEAERIGFVGGVMQVKDVGKGASPRSHSFASHHIVCDHDMIGVAKKNRIPRGFHTQTVTTVVKVVRCGLFCDNSIELRE